MVLFTKTNITPGDRFIYQAEFPDTLWPSQAVA